MNLEQMQDLQILTNRELINMGVVMPFPDVEILAEAWYRFLAYVDAGLLPESDTYADVLLEESPAPALARF